MTYKLLKIQSKYAKIILLELANGHWERLVYMKIISWNLNGLLSCVENGSFNAIADLKPDIVCLQEIRTNEEPKIIAKYKHFFNHCDRQKYSGTAILTAKPPKRVYNGFESDFSDVDFPDNEGRIMTVEFEKLYVVNVYVPNSQQNLERSNYRLEWDTALYDYIDGLIYDKPVIICGDFNTVRSELDFFEENMRQMWSMQGYLSDEQSNLESLLELGLTDVFRELYPTTRSYTWWSNRLNRREVDRGWRLDYFLVSDNLMKNVVDIKHLSDIKGSDHCPIMLEVKI